MELYWHWLREGWQYRYARNPDMEARRAEYRDRVAYESDLIVSKDFVDYFLLLSDVVRFAKDSGIPVGPARGSAAGSLVCYLLRITEVNPMHFPQMVFERFLDPTRADLPDVDLDFPDDRREEVREYLVRKYGAECVGNIANFVRYLGKTSINDVARVYRTPHAATNTIKDLLIVREAGDARFSNTIEDTLEAFPQAKRAFKAFPELEYAIKLEGNHRGMNVHAAGLVVSNRPIAETTALITRVVAGHPRTVVAVDKRDAEYLGMLKMDFLSLSTLGSMMYTLDMMGMSLDELYATTLDEPKTLKAFRDGDVMGIFQFEGRTTRSICLKLQPTNFMHLAHVNALSRPGALASGQTTKYLAIRNNEMKISSLHPVVEEITGETYGQLVFQEQVLRLARDFGGMPGERVNKLRKVIGQKLGGQAFNEMKEEFLSTSVDKEVAPAVWDLMVESSGYSFNVAHAVSYSMLAYWQMWLKVHHPAEFFAGAMRKVKDDKANVEWRRPRMLRDAQRRGIKVVAPRPNSGENWTSEDGALIAGYRQVPGIGEKQAMVIAGAGPHAAWNDILKIKGIGPKTVDAVRAFADSEDPFGLDLTGAILRDLRRQIRRRDGGLRHLPLPTHRSDELPQAAYVTWVGVVRERKYWDLMEEERAKSGEPTEAILKRLDRPDLLKSCKLECYDDGDEEVYVRFSRFRFPEFADRLDSIEPGNDIVIVSGYTGNAQSIGASIRADKLYVISVGNETEEDGDA